MNKQKVIRIIKKLAMLACATYIGITLGDLRDGKES